MRERAAIVGNRKTPATPEEIACVLELIRPRKKEEERCRTEVIDCIRMIAERSPSVTPSGAVKRQLQRLAIALFKARTEINSLPSEWRDKLRLEHIPSELDRIRRESERLAENVKVKRSGGAAQSRADSPKKQLAASYAFDLLIFWGREPTLTKDSDYFTLASLLFMIATDRESGDMERPCNTHIRNLRRDGYPGREELRQLRRQGKVSSKDAPEWLVALHEDED